MIISRSTKQEYAWNTIGVFAQNLISPLVLVVITRVNGLSDSGLFSFAFSVAIIFWAIAMWGGRTYQVSDVRHEFLVGNYVAVRLFLGLFVLAGAIIFSVINGYDIAKSSLLILLVIFKIIESFSDAIYGILQVHKKLYIVGKSLLYKTLLSLTLFITIDITTKNIMYASIGIIIANISILLAYDLRQTKKVHTVSIWTDVRRASIKSVLEIINRCFPAFVVVFLAMFSLNIPRYFIDMHHPEELGVFGIIAMPVTLVALFMTFVMQPNTLRLSSSYDRKEHEKFDKTVRSIFGLTAVIGAGILFFAYILGIPALKVVFGIDFSNYKLALMIIIVGGIFNALVTVFINILVIMRSFKAQLWILISSNMVLVILAAMYVSMYGLIGGVVLFAIINIIQFALFYITYLYLLKKRINEKN